MVSAIRLALARVGVGGAAQAGEAGAMRSLRRAVEAVQERLTIERDALTQRGESRAEDATVSGPAEVAGSTGSTGPTSEEVEQAEREHETKRRAVAEKRREALAAIKGRSAAEPPSSEPTQVANEVPAAERTSRKLAEQKRRRRQQGRE